MVIRFWYLYIYCINGVLLDNIYVISVIFEFVFFVIFFNLNGRMFVRNGFWVKKRKRKVIRLVFNLIDIYCIGLILLIFEFYWFFIGMVFFLLLMLVVNVFFVYI